MNDLYSKSVLYDYATSFLGVPYRWGGDDPMQGLDCSGLVIELLQSQGVLPHRYDNTAKGLYRDLPKRGAQETSPEFGALVFFGKSADKISHVGMCLTHTLMIEAGGGNSKTVDEESAAKMNAFVRVRPISIRSDVVGYLMPKYIWR